MQELPCQLTTGQLAASFTGRKFLFETKIRRYLVCLWLTLPVCWAAVFLSSNGCMPAWMLVRLFNYPNLVALIAARLDPRLTHWWNKIPWRTCLERVKGGVKAARNLLHSSTKWILHVGDQVPVPLFDGRWQFSQATPASPTLQCDGEG